MSEDIKPPVMKISSGSSSSTVTNPPSSSGSNPSATGSGANVAVSVPLDNSKAAIGVWLVKVLN